MSTRDLGTHIVELHERGMLCITGEGTRLTLPAHEALDLLNWLNQQSAVLSQVAQQEYNEAIPDWLRGMKDEINAPADERDLPEDEP